jgi:hypothetical protein
MRFELVPEPAESAERAAQVALAVAGISLDSDPPAYRGAWRRAAMEEAAGHVDEVHGGAAVDAGTHRRDSLAERRASDAQVQRP